MATPGFFPIKGGTETVVYNLTVKLNEIGIHTDVLTFNMDKKWEPKWKGETWQLNKFQVYRIPGLNWYPLSHSDRITMGINLIPGKFTHILKKYDIIHFHEDFSFPFFAFFCDKPKILHLHGLHGVDFYDKYFLVKFILRNVADMYICITDAMRKNLISMGICEHKVKYLPNGVDTELFSPRGKKISNLLLFTGRIVFQKGLHILLESLSFLKIPIKLIIIGPLDKESCYGRRILSMIEKENKMGRHKVIYLGELRHEDLVEWYRKAAIFILPCVKPEAFGVVSLEALACETPVIATNIGGIPEVVRHNENGLLIPPNDPIKLAESIQYLLENGHFRNLFGKAGRKWVLENFSLNVIVKRLCGIYTELLAKANI
jgi:glycosyltransferase involved in cell wall biosynthesis